MEEKRAETAEQVTDTSTPEKKDYHAPELSVYGDMRELTMTNPFEPGNDGPLFEATAT